MFKYCQTMQDRANIPPGAHGVHRPPLRSYGNALAFDRMQILRKRKPVLRENSRTLLLHSLVLASASVAAAFVAGCASPGTPLPPSLKLPQPVADLTATRIGNQVVLHWTTPARTTDRLLIAGPVTAEVCRDAASAAPARTTRASAKCNVV